MDQLANIFVALVTFAQTLAPNANIGQILDYSPRNNANQAVLAETSENPNEASGSSVSNPRLMEVRKNQAQRRQELQEKRDQAKILRDQNRNQLSEQLQIVRSEKKKQIITRIAENIEKLNTKWVDHWTSVLDRLETIVTKIESKTTDSEVLGKVSEARVKISQAREQVENQAAKVYTIAIPEEEGIGQSVKTTINEFHNDIKNTRESVDQARKSVVEALKTLKAESQTQENED